MEHRMCNMSVHSIYTSCAVSCAFNCVALIIYSFRFFIVFVCLCAAVYGVTKNNNLVRLSSIVPFHIIYQVNLYWRNNSAHKYSYFETLFHTLAFHTNFSRIFHPCNLVPHFHVSHFPPLHFWPSRIFMSRSFSRPHWSSTSWPPSKKEQSVKQASKIQTSQLLFIGLVDPYDPA